MDALILHADSAGLSGNRELLAIFQSLSDLQGSLTIFDSDNQFNADEFMLDINFWDDEEFYSKGWTTNRLSDSTK